MKRSVSLLAAAAAVVFGAALVQASVSVGQPAPDFRVKDTSGKEQSLSAYKGKYVVLEWVNPDCPFVKKHYDSANMQATQKAAEAKGAVWLSVSTGAGGKASELDAWVNILGVEAMTAIRAATYWPSLAMKVDRDVGTVTPGKYADIIAVRGDVLRHIALLQRVDVVVKRGTRYK